MPTSIESKSLKFALYARNATSNQAKVNRKEQIMICADAVAHLGGSIEETLLFVDEPSSGNSVPETRSGLTALLNAAADPPRSIDILVIADASRLARNLSVLARIISTLERSGVRIYLADRRRFVDDPECHASKWLWVADTRQLRRR